MRCYTAFCLDSLPIQKNRNENAGMQSVSLSHFHVGLIGRSFTDYSYYICFKRISLTMSFASRLKRKL